jgi:acetyl coenzyme A synthetase (ADP forming)-like protein
MAVRSLVKRLQGTDLGPVPQHISRLAARPVAWPNVTNRGGIVIVPVAEQAEIQDIVQTALSEGRTYLSPAEARRIAVAYGIPVPGERVAHNAGQAVAAFEELGGPVVLKVISEDIPHKTDAGGVVVGLASPTAVQEAYDAIIARSSLAVPGARIDGVLVQQMAGGGTEVIVGAVTDPSFGKLVAFGIGGVLVEVLKDVVFRLAPVSPSEARAMLDRISARQLLDGVRGAPPVDREAIASIVEAVGRIATDMPAIKELDLNPVIATPSGAVAVDVRIAVGQPLEPRFRPAHDDIVIAMNRIMKPDSVAVIGASAEEGKIGNSVMKNLINGGYRGRIYPVHPRAAEIEGIKAYPSVKAVEGPIDVAVFAIPAPLVPNALRECGEKGIPGAVLIPSGFAETGNVAEQEELQRIGREYNIRLMGPNIYGFYYTHKNLCATFCTAYDIKGRVALSSQSGGIGMAIVGFSRSAGMGVSAIVGLGNKSDIDEDDLLIFFEQDENTQVIAQHFEDLKDGRAFAEVASRVSKTKPIIALKAGRTAAGARAASSHTGALAGNDKVYEDILESSGVIRARTLRDLLEFARGMPELPTPKGENVVIITGAGGSGVLLSDACFDNDLTLMAMPPDLDAAFREFIPPFGAAGNPVDITGGEPPTTYRATIKLALEDERIHSLILGYWHTIITPPMVFARLVVEVVDELKARGIHKPVVASLAGDVEVEEASEFLYRHGIPAYPYSTEIPVQVLGAKYRWARRAGLL